MFLLSAPVLSCMAPDEVNPSTQRVGLFQSLIQVRPVERRALKTSLPQAGSHPAAPLDLRTSASQLKKPASSLVRSGRAARSRDEFKNATLPWYCGSKVVWHDLGPLTFPRFMRDVECVQSTCWFGHFRCVGKALSVKVIQRDGEPTTNPIGLQENWRVKDVTVTLYCECSR